VLNMMTIDRRQTELQPTEPRQPKIINPPE
jgi:hypothetical protein